jgi:hypothetical protein
MAMIFVLIAGYRSTPRTDRQRRISMKLRARRASVPCGPRQMAQVRAELRNGHDRDCMPDDFCAI